MARAVSVLGQPDVRAVSVFIYALTEPDGTVRYIGKSHSPTARLGSHLSATAARPVAAWMDELESRGEKPGLKILHEVPPGEDVGPWELLFIRAYRPSGKLLNAMFRVELQEVPKGPCVRRINGETVGSMALRKALGVFGMQRVCSVRTGIAQCRISRLTRGEAVPSIAEAYALELATGVPVAWWAQPVSEKGRAHA